MLQIKVRKELILIKLFIQKIPSELIYNFGYVVLNAYNCSMGLVSITIFFGKNSLILFLCYLV